MKTDQAICVATIMAAVTVSMIVAQVDYYPPMDTSTEPINHKEVKCLVCKATVDEMLDAIGKVDPKKTIDIGGYRLEANGNRVQKSLPLTKSETYLTELMENICDKMDDYAKARFKSNRRLTVLKMTTASGGMNPEMSNVDFIQDGDLNKSLKHYCLEILDDHDDAVVSLFRKDELSANIDIHLCTEAAKYCDDTIPEDDYLHEEL